MSVMISTAYMDEAERWDWIVAMDAGKVLATGTPAELMARTGTSDLEKCFIELLPEEKRTGHVELTIPPRPKGKAEIAIDAQGPTRRFGDFVAVDHVTLTIERGEIFGFLGSNGCGKSTTMKMLTGLLPPTEGSATLFGQSVEAGSIEVRNNIGYMTQAFSLYGELTVRQNLVYSTRAFITPRRQSRTRIDQLVEKLWAVRPLISAGGRSAHGPAPAAIPRGRGCCTTRTSHSRRADLGRRSGRARRLLGIADRSLAQSGRDDLRHDPLHERGDALRPYLAHERRQGACLRRPTEAHRSARRGDARRSLYRLHGGRDRRKGKTEEAAQAAADKALEKPEPRHLSGMALRIGRMLAYSANEAMQILRDPCGSPSPLSARHFLCSSSASASRPMSSMSLCRPSISTRPPKAAPISSNSRERRAISRRRSRSAQPTAH